MHEFFGNPHWYILILHPVQDGASLAISFTAVRIINMTRLLTELCFSITNVVFKKMGLSMYDCFRWTFLIHLNDLLLDSFYHLWSSVWLVIFLPHDSLSITLSACCHTIFMTLLCVFIFKLSLVALSFFLVTLYLTLFSLCASLLSSHAHTVSLWSFYILVTLVASLILQWYQIFLS